MDMTYTLRVTATLALGTLLESIRSRLLWVSAVFAVVLVGLSVSAASVALYERSRLIVDVGLAAVAGLGSAIAIAATVSFFAAQLGSRTAYAVLVRPLPRWAFVLGRSLGLWAAMLLVLVAMALATAGVVAAFGAELPDAFWPAVWLGCMQVGVVIAVTILFSTVAVPALAATYASGIIIAASLSEDIAALAARHQSPQTAQLLRAVYYILPDFGKLSLRAQAANNLPIPEHYVLTGTLYGLVYAAAALCLAMLVFNRRRAL